MSRKVRKELNAWRRKQPQVMPGEVLYKGTNIEIVGKTRPEMPDYPLAAIDAGAVLKRIKEEAAEFEEKYISTRQKKEIKDALKVINLQLSAILQQLNRVVVGPKTTWYSKLLFWRKS
jgi:hypothetical protein